LDKSSNLVDVKGIINQNSTGYYALRPYCGFKEHGFCYYAKSSHSCYKQLGERYENDFID
ncbi:MAG: hypothetical protein ACOX6L_09565, partial [Syntrophomonadaceae bacterium]